jgi:glycosyltransferase involved in cell wall biosynthesis
LRVLQLVPALFGEGGIFGGVERLAFELARHMAERTPTTLVTFGENERRERVGKLNLRILGHPFYVRGQRNNPISTGLFSELRQADVVHCHQQHIVASSAAALFCRLTRRRVYVSDSGGGGWDISGYISTDRWYDGHLHVSNFSRKVFGHTDKPFAHVTYGGTDATKFCPDPTVRRERTVVYAGRLLPHKGVNYLVEAVPATVKLRLIGREADQRFLADLLRLAQGKSVTIEQNCDDAELIAAYREAACAVLPSVYRDMYGGETVIPELLGQTVLEAMACGTPVICTAVASMPELVIDGVNGFLVPPNDPVTLRERICWLLEHPSEAAEMGQAARQRVLDQFTWPAVVERCLAIYTLRA